MKTYSYRKKYSEYGCQYNQVRHSNISASAVFVMDLAKGLAIEGARIVSIAKKDELT